MSVIFSGPHSDGVDQVECAKASCDVSVSGIGETAVLHIEHVDSDGLSLVPGAAIDDSNLACLCENQEKVVIPPCADTSTHRADVGIEAPWRTICRAQIADSFDRDTRCGADCIQTSTEKQSSVSSACPGDMVSYTITFTNYSTVALVMVRIADEMPAGMTVVLKSIRPAPQPGETLLSGISVGSVEPGCSVILTYDAIVDFGAPDLVVNCARAVYSFQDCRGCLQSGIGSTRCCAVGIASGNPGIAVVKSADRRTVCKARDEIIYTLAVSNCGDTALADVVAYDDIPEGLCYKRSSTSKNGESCTDENPLEGIPLGTLQPGESVLVSFVLFVCPATGGGPPCEFENKARVSARASGVEISANSNSWIVALQRSCICKCVQNGFPICDLCCIQSCYVYQVSVTHHYSAMGHMVKVWFGIAVEYVNGNGERKSHCYLDQVVFRHLPDGFAPTCFRVRLTGLCCCSDHRGDVSATFRAMLCYCNACEMRES